MDATSSQHPGSPAPQGSPPRTPGRPSLLPTLLGYAVALLCVVLLASLLPRSGHELSEATGRLAPAPESRAEVEHLRALMQEARTAQRGYLLLRDEATLAAHEDVRRRIGLSLGRLRSLMTGDAPHEDLTRVVSLVEQELASMQAPVTLMRTGKASAALQTLREATGSRVDRELREFSRTLAEEEEQRARERRARLEHAAGRDNLLVLGSGGFLLIFLGLRALAAVGAARQHERDERERARESMSRADAGGERQRSHSQRILQQLPAAVGLFRASDRKCDLANPALVKLHGGRELVGRGVNDLHAEPQGGRLLEMFNTVLSTGQPSTANGHPLVLERTPDGRTREVFVNITYQPLHDARGQVEAVLLFAVEVTEQVGARRAAEEALAQRQRAEAALRENEAHLRRTLKASDVGAWEADLRTRRMVWSTQVESMSGLLSPSAPTTLEAFLALVHPEDRTALAQRLTPSASDPGEFRLEYRVLRADGARWHENRGRVLLDDAGQPVKLIGVILDITPRKLAEQSHLESENRFRLLAETVPQLIWLMRADGAAEYFNPRWYEYTGQDPEQARGDGWMRALHPDDVAPTVAATRSAFSTGEPYVIEYRLRRGSDAAYRWFIARGLALRDAAGTCTNWIGTCTDIDEQKRAAESLRFLSEVGGVLASSLDHAQTLKQVARLAVPMLADWCIVDVVREEDAQMERVEVTHADPALGELAHTLRRYPPASRLPHPSQQALSTDQSVYLAEVTSTHLERITQDAEHLRAALALKLRSLVSVPLVARGRTLGVLTFLTTSLSGRRYERGDVARLEQLAQRAALAIDNARLFSLAREERSRAEAASRLKDEFLATVSHELRTPLTAMIGWLKLLRDGRLPPAKHARALETVDRNAHAQAQLIEDLLDVSRIVSGKLRLNAQPVHLVGVIEEALESVRPAAEAKGMRLNAELDAGEDVVMGDAARLQQVVWNLLSNAVKFSPGQHGVWVRLRSVGPAVELTVEDEGPGIPEDFLPHLFEHFRRLEGGSTRQHGGLGLGLAIVRHLVELHGGTVHATSGAPGRGALFTVRLPRGLVQPVSESPAPEDDAPPLPTSYPALAGRRILVVDDEEDSREMLRWSMEDHGAHVIAASSASEALRLLRAERPELLVSDIAMPGDDGYALITRVRALPAAEGGTIAAVALTAYARVEDRARALTAGFDMHVSKPVEPDELLSVLSNLVSLSPRS